MWCSPSHVCSARCFAAGASYSVNSPGRGSTARNIVALQLVMDGLKLQPCRPTFLDARDAILLADQNNNDGGN